MSSTQGEVTSNGKKLTRAQLKRLKRKQNKKKKKKLLKEFSKKKRAREASQEAKPVEDVEVEYVTENPLEDMDEENTAYADFAKVFAHFDAKDEDEDMEEQNNSDSEGEEDGEDEKLISNKQKRLKKRLDIAILKQLVTRPDLVEIWDCSAADPWLLLHFKSLRNSVPVPRHWCQKRKYLQGKRGIEKPPFELPEFIQKTGIMRVRDASGAGGSAGLRQSARDRMNPKMGRLDIDYQVLHDAFFRYQTKPQMTRFGDLYYEGKEFELKVQEKRPGVLNEALTKALGMPPGAPPPWLINMQRVGPPPSYPKLKIPGLNAPIPDNAVWGFGPGQWGKPPVDELGRPLYGDVFGVGQPEAPPIATAPIQRSKWGILPDDYSSSEEEEELEGDDVDMGVDDDDMKGMETPITSSIQPPQPPMPPPPSETPQPPEPKQLYQVLEQKDTSVGDEFLGSSHTYKIDKKKKDNRVDIIRSKKTDEFDVTLDPEDLQLSEAELKKKYEKALKDKQREKITEDSKKRKRDRDDRDPKRRKYKDFKF
mmetsp:Transcript_25215/g.28042  ORF Transcript_25215/g.28042 Transcript_25215/m.28042 type:complete len:536 (-) Transcript_25215:99-1706(-)